MTAVLHVRRPSGALGLFLADSCNVEQGIFTATGRWRYGSGRLSTNRRTYSWPSRVVVECCWEEA